MKLISVMKFLKKQPKDILNYIILDLLNEEKIQFDDLAKLYVKFLEIKDKHNRTEKRLFAQSLGMKYQNDFSEYQRARDRLMLDEYLPNEFFDKFMFNIDKKALEKEKANLKKWRNEK